MALKSLPTEYKLKCSLTRDDWQYIEYAVALRIQAASAKKGEPDNSTAFKTQTTNIRAFLMHMAFKDDPSELVP